MPSLRTGLDLLVEDPALLRGRRFALLTNHAAVTHDLAPAWQALASVGGTLVRLLAPEHGLWGVAQDMEAVGEEREPARGLPVHSLYGTTAATLTPTPALLDGLDALVVDLPDVGCRVYTFAATLAYAMTACARAGVEVIVCDRPNPIGGTALEGGPVEPWCRSFVSELVELPVRHGLTLGEIALALRHSRCPELALSVVTCPGWRREQWWDETGLPWVAPSPNMPSLTTAAVYPGGCLVEATNLSEGRGTTRPFQLIGAPWLDAAGLAVRLERAALPGVRFRATRFRPEFHKHAGEVCEGLEWHILDRRAMRPLEAGVHLLAAVRSLHPEHFAWRKQAYEFVAGVPAIDLLTGSPRARAVVEGEGEPDALFAEWESHCERFRERRREVLLYPE
ncbi:MAG: exo-beta-N-acetylmuramidase NamZ domain-containing protein [Acidobacteriota bacterium]